ncbi:MAG TPA: hypothetical protein VF498_21010, partial [Anaerolineales bacterium]
LPGVLLAGAGVFLALRQGKQAPPTPTGPARRVRGVEILRTLKVTLAVEGSPALLPPAGLTLASQATAGRASSVAAPANAPATAAGARRLFQALAQAWPYLPSLTIAMGVFVLLPAVIALLAQAQSLENPARIAAFFSAPVLLLWITAEAVYFAHFNQSGLPGLPRLLGMLASAVQALSAVILWIFLGLSLGLQGMEWLFWVGAGLALLGAVLATAAAVLGNRRLEP